MRVHESGLLCERAAGIIQQWGGLCKKEWLSIMVEHKWELKKKMDRKEEKRKERRKKMSCNMRQTENIENHSEKQI